MLDIQSAAAENRRGNMIAEDRRKKKAQDENIMDCPIP